MQAEKISASLAAIMSAMARDEMPTPRFHDTPARDAWIAEGNAIQEAGKLAAANLIADALANLGSIAQSLAIIAEGHKRTGKELLFGGVVSASDGKPFSAQSE